MKEGQNKVYLDSSTYVTKVNGRTVLVRNRHHILPEKKENFGDICAALLRGVFTKYTKQKMKNSSEIPQGKSAVAQNPSNIPLQGLMPFPLFNPSANLVGSASPHSTIGPIGLQTGIYRFGDRQMALLPLTPQGGPANLPEVGNPYPQQPWMFPMTSNTFGYDFPPMSTDQGQLFKNRAPDEVSSEVTVSVMKHVCAECCRPRSKKYHYKNPLKAGETPIPELCKRCQKDMTSTEESDTSARTTEKHRARSKRHARKPSMTEGDPGHSRDLIEIEEKPKSSNLKVKKFREKSSEEHLKREKVLQRASLRQMSSSPNDNKGVAIREHYSSLPDPVHSDYSRSTNSSQGHMGRKHEKEAVKDDSHSSYEAKQSSRYRRVAKTTEKAWLSQRAHSQSRNKISHTDSGSIQSRSNESSRSSGTMPDQVCGSEDTMISSSKPRSEDSSRRRRLGRSGVRNENSEFPHRIRSPMEDEIEVITERYIYRPRALCLEEGNLESRNEEIRDSATSEIRKSRQTLEMNTEALEYYRSDWARISEQDEGAHQCLRSKDLEGLGLGAEIQTSEINPCFLIQSRDDVQSLPRARNQSQRSLSIHHDQCLPLQSEAGPSTQKKGYSYAGHRTPANGEDIHPCKRPYVQDVRDRETEGILVLSPKQPGERYLYPETNESELTEEIERLDRHVVFRDLGSYEEDDHVISDETVPAQAVR